MNVRQISVFLENSAGRLAGVCQCLGQHGINLRALSLADASDFGVLRVIVNNPDETLRVLKHEGFAASATEVLAVEVPDRPGGLGEVLALLHRAGINVEYMYAFVERTGAGALVVMRVEQREAAARALGDAGIRLLSEADIIAL